MDFSNISSLTLGQPGSISDALIGPWQEQPCPWDPVLAFTSICKCKNVTQPGNNASAGGGCCDNSRLQLDPTVGAGILFTQQCRCYGQPMCIPARAFPMY